jgi:hypothetical protein
VIGAKRRRVVVEARTANCSVRIVLSSSPLSVCLPPAALLCCTSHAGVAYAEKCRFDDSKVCYEMAVLFDPKCAEAYNNLGTQLAIRAGPTRDWADQRPIVTRRKCAVWPCVH